MRKLFGFLLAALGLAFAHAAYQNAPSHREDQLAEVTRILTNPGVDVGSQTAGTTTLPNSAVPGSPGVTSASERSLLGTTQTAQAKPPVAAATAGTFAESATITAAPQSPTSAWQTSVKADAQRPGTTTAVTSAAPGDGAARYELVRALQKELKRVGCYNGEAHGSWGNSSKRALTAFMDRVNSTLPVDKPDYIQLTLLQNQKTAVCGAECPKGQSPAENGRCVPSAIMARGDTLKSDPAKSGAAKSGETQTAAVAAEQLPWANDTQPAPTAPQTYETASVQPPAIKPSFAGRMSVGAPPPPAGPEPALERAPGPEAAEAAPSVRPAPNVRPAKTSVKVAALAPAPAVAPRPAQAKTRIVVPKAYYAPKSYRVVSRPAPRQRVRYSYRTQRSVQSLFTHPLGRM